MRSSNGVQVAVQAERAYRQERTVHNLTIEGIHTYYVLAGDMPVLAHNCGAGTADAQKLADRLRLESANSPFAPDGSLTQDALDSARLVQPGSKMGNMELQARFAERGGAAQWGKFSTPTYQS